MGQRGGDRLPDEASAVIRVPQTIVQLGDSLAAAAGTSSSGPNSRWPFAATPASSTGTGRRDEAYIGLGASCSDRDCVAATGRHARELAAYDSEGPNRLWAGTLDPAPVAAYSPATEPGQRWVLTSDEQLSPADLRVPDCGVLSSGAGCRWTGAGLRSR